MTKYACTQWLADEDVLKIETAAYWNDREAEKKKKQFQVSSDSSAPFEEIPKYRCISEQAHGLISDLSDKGWSIGGRGVSLASGVCWLEADLLDAYPAISHLTCVELSLHRIFEIAPGILERKKIAPERVTLAAGDIMRTPIEAHSLDFAMICQGFHHVSDPEGLLAEMSRILKPEAPILILGEHYWPLPVQIDRAARHVVKWAIDYKGTRQRCSIVPTFTDLFPYDPVKGDHHYRPETYARMFSQAGYQHIRRASAAYREQGFALYRP